MGLSSGVFCLGYCSLPLSALLVTAPQRTFLRAAGLIGIFLGGRLTGYLLVGAVCGIIGASWPGITAAREAIFAVAQGALGIFLIAYGIGGFNPAYFRGECRVVSPGRFPFFGAGFLTGLHICPPFLAAMTSAVALGDIGRAVVFFFFFFLGTSLFILPLVFLSPLAHRDEVRVAGRIVAVIFGIGFIARTVWFYCSRFF